MNVQAQDIKLLQNIEKLIIAKQKAPQVLLGAEYALQYLGGEHIKVPCGRIVIKSPLGVIVAGEGTIVKAEFEIETTSQLVLLGAETGAERENKQLDKMVRRF